MSDDDANCEIGDRFLIVAKLGEGTYGHVYKAISNANHKEYALKRMKINYEEEGVPATAIREVSLLKECDHPNIIKLYEVIALPTSLYLVLEFLDMDLRAFLRRQGPYLDPLALRNAVCQCISGIAFCHAVRILHRDLKPQNVLVDATGQRYKIADFGLARAFSVPLRTYTREVVTLWYRAPEILLGQSKYATPTDIWSLGCIVGEMATGIPMFPGDSEIDTIFKIFRALGTPNEEVWPGVSTLRNFTQEFPKWTSSELVHLERTAPSLGPDGWDLLKQCFRYDPIARPSARQLSQHRFFDAFERHTITQG